MLKKKMIYLSTLFSLEAAVKLNKLKKFKFKIGSENVIIFHY